MKKSYLKVAGIAGCLIFSALVLFAQEDEKVKIEEVKQQCSAMPLDKRARISVTRFTVTTRQPGTETQRNAAANNVITVVAAKASQRFQPNSYFKIMAIPTASTFTMASGIKMYQPRCMS